MRPAPSPRLPLRPLPACALVLAVISLAGCVVYDADPAARSGKAKGPEATLFISPAGKPFRGDPGAPYPVRVWFAEADANHDGKLTRDEFRADFAAFFKMLDANHDGVIDGVETADYEENVAPEVLPRLAQVGGGFPGERGGAERRGPRRLAQAPVKRGDAFYDGAPEYSLLNVSEPVSSADLNFDGRVTMEEYLAAADKRFDLLDTAHLGYLSLDALPQTPEQVGVEGKRKAPAR